MIRIHSGRCDAQLPSGRLGCRFSFLKLLTLAAGPGVCLMLILQGDAGLFDLAE